MLSRPPREIHKARYRRLWIAAAEGLQCRSIALQPFLLPWAVASACNSGTEMHAQRCPWLLRADRRGSARRGGPGSARGCKSLWCVRHCGRAITGWCVCLPLAPVGGWPYLAIGQRGGATTSVRRCGSSPALPSQRPPRPGEPLFERSSHRGGGAPVAHGLPQSRRFTLALTTPLSAPPRVPPHPHGSCRPCYSRIRGGAAPSSKWQCTASRICRCSCSRLSGSV